MKNIQVLSLSELMKKAVQHDKRLKKQLRIEGKYVVFHVRGEYAVELSRCKSSKSILQWVHHLSEKSWITVPLLGRFISLATSYHKIDIFKPTY